MGKAGNTYSIKRYLIVLSVATAFFLFLIGLLGYIVDPFFQFRVKSDSKYFLNPLFVNGGLAKNYDYNTVVLGSSMAQNYNLSIIRKNDAEAKPVKLSSGGMNIDEMEYLYSFIKKDSTKELIINLDIIQFNNALSGGVRYPRYLYEDGIINKLQYLYSYETVVRYIPIDLGLTFYLKDDTKLTPQYRRKTSIDDIGNTSMETNYGADYVKGLYNRGITVSAQELNGMEDRMASRFDSMLQVFDMSKYKETKFIFVLPPYSALYWQYAQRQGYCTQLMSFVRYLNRVKANYPNMEVLYFYDINEIMNLNNYSDITHFNPKLSDLILENIHNREYILKNSNVESKIQRLDSLVNVFKEENQDWLN